MSAPENEFIQKRLETLVGTTTKDARIGIYDATGTPAQVQATLKSRYYLDFIRGVSEYDANGVEVVDKSGFIGGCVIGSDNYYMHNTARHWSVGSLTASNEVLFNDAGKNTLGVINNPLLNSVNIENFVVAQIISKSAFWVNGTYGIQINKDGSGWISPVSNSQIRNNETTLLNVNIADSVEFDENIQLRLFHQNNEGTFFSSIISQRVLAAPIIMKFDDTYASYANNATTSQTYYYTVRGLLMSTIFLDTLGNTEAPDGYFVYDGYWYRHTFSAEAGARIITAFGKAESGHYPDGDPGNPQTGYSTYNWYAYHASSQTGACSAIYAPVVTYRRNSDGRHFMNTTLTTPAPNGYYIEDALAKGWFHIENQLLINSGSC